MVNPAVFKALDRFDEALSGVSHDERLTEIVGKVFADFSIMRDRSIRGGCSQEKRQALRASTMWICTATSTASGT